MFVENQVIYLKTCMTADCVTDGSDKHISEKSRCFVKRNENKNLIQIRKRLTLLVTFSVLSCEDVNDLIPETRRGQTDG